MHSAATGSRPSPISTGRTSAGRKRWIVSSSCGSSSTASRKHSRIETARRRSCFPTTSESAGKPGGLERPPCKRLVDFTRQAAHADGADPRLAVEGRQPAEEEREERVEALAFDGILARLRRQLSRRTCVASCRCIGLPVRVQARIRCGTVHGRGCDELAVRVRDENRDRAGRLPHDEIDDRLGVRELHRAIVGRSHTKTKKCCSSGQCASSPPVSYGAPRSFSLPPPSPAWP